VVLSGRECGESGLGLANRDWRIDDSMGLAGDAALALAALGAACAAAGRVRVLGDAMRAM
jgi:hypothetical protein